MDLSSFFRLPRDPIKITVSVVSGYLLITIFFIINIFLYLFKMGLKFKSRKNKVSQAVHNKPILILQGATRQQEEGWKPGQHILP